MVDIMCFCFQAIPDEARIIDRSASCRQNDGWIGVAARFERKGCDIFWIELESDLAVRLIRNRGENRLNSLEGGDITSKLLADRHDQFVGKRCR